MSLLLYIPKILCRVTVFGCSYNGYSKQEYELVGWECERTGSRELPPTCTVAAAGPWGGGRPGVPPSNHCMTAVLTVLLKDQYRFPYIV